MLPSGELSDELGSASRVAATSGGTSGVGSLVIAYGLSSQRPPCVAPTAGFCGLLACVSQTGRTLALLAENIRLSSSAHHNSPGRLAFPGLLSAGR
jgi:hypothetical protein